MFRIMAPVMARLEHTMDLTARSSTSARVTMDGITGTGMADTFTITGTIIIKPIGRTLGTVVLVAGRRSFIE